MSVSAGISSYFVSCLVLAVGSFLMLPINLLLPSKFILKKEFHPKVSVDLQLQSSPYAGVLPSSFLDERVQLSVGPLGFPLIIHAPGSSSAHNASQRLLEWYGDNEGWFADSIKTYGGVLLRGFSIEDVRHFDGIVAGIHKDSQGTGIYLGTAPRKKIPGTKFTSSASEVTSSATISCHLELCYTHQPPSRLYFYVEQPNLPPGGQTPLADFRQVWRDFPANLREKLLSKGLLYKRWYYNEERGSWDPLQHKSWQAMFMTSNSSEVERLAASEGFHAAWDAGDNLLLTHLAVVSRAHESTGEAYWNTHFNVLHAGTVTAPLAYSAQILDDRRALIPYFILSWLMYFRHSLLGYEYGSDMVYADDQSSLSFQEAMTIRKLIYKNTWIFDWAKGDVLMLDNHRIAHGRTPYYKGERKVYVAWQ